MKIIYKTPIKNLEPGEIVAVTFNKMDPVVKRLGGTQFVGTVIESSPPPTDIKVEDIEGTAVVELKDTACEGTEWRDVQAYCLWSQLTKIG